MDARSRWVQELRANGRSADAIRVLVALVDAVEAVYAEEIRTFLDREELADAGRTSRAVDALSRALGRAQQAATRLIRDRAQAAMDALNGDLFSRVRRAVGLPQVPEVVVTQFTRQAERYIAGQTGDIAAAAERAVRDWTAAGGTQPELRTALAEVLRTGQGHAATVVRSELQHSYVALVQAQAPALGFPRVRRIVAETACDDCKRLAGTHAADSADAYAVPHPNCACTFEPEYDEEELATMSGRSYREIEQFVRTALQEKHRNTYVFLNDIYDDAVIYSVEKMGATGPTSPTSAPQTLRRSYVIADDGIVTLGEPEAVQAVTTYQPVVQMAQFTLSDGDTVVDAHTNLVLFGTRRGKIFEAGSYPDRNFTISAEELAAAAAAFAPVACDLEHIPTILDGQLGRLTAVEVGEDGRTLFGTVDLPDWMIALVGDAAVKVSTTWDRVKKQIVGLALCLEPRVKDAQVVAAFAGRQHSAKDITEFQSIHDLMVRHGATCHTEMSQSRAPSPRSTPQEAHMPTLEVNDEQMTFLRSLLERQPGGTTQPPANQAATFSQQTEQPQSNDETAQLREQVAALQAENRRTAAVAFADQLVRDRRILPADRENVISEYITAAEDDTANPRTVAFTVGTEKKEGNRVEALTARYQARAQHTIVEGGETRTVRALFSETPPAKDSAPSPERMEQLKGMTALGRATLNGKH